MSMHLLLARQLVQYFKGAPPDAAGFAEFARAVGDAYRASDDDLSRLEREFEERSQALQRDAAERERAQSERDAFFRASPDMLTIIGDDLRVVLANPGWTQVLGYQPSTLVGTSFLDTVHPDDVARVIHLTSALAHPDGERATVTELEFQQRTVGGEWRTISARTTFDSERRRYFAVGRDVTNQRAMARELEQANRLEAVGQLASGMAHEINTPIQYIGDNVQFAAEGFAGLLGYLRAVEQLLTGEQRTALVDAARTGDVEYVREELPRSLGEAGEGVRRVAELVKALKEFAHPDLAEKAHADINKALERAVVMARGELRHVAQVETDFGQLPPLACYVGSLSQVFLNLLVNAAHAVEERTQKHGVPMADHRVRVVTRVEVDEIVIRISDTGCGIPQSIRDRIYEPFFTTKPMGKGSGQGLPLVRDIIIGKHSGTIELDSEVNVGTTFTLRLPLHSPSYFGKAA